MPRTATIKKLRPLPEFPLDSHPEVSLDFTRVKQYLESRALLHEDLQHPRVGIRLHREVRAHPRQRRAEAPCLDAHDVEVDEQHRPLVGMSCEVLLDPGEVETDLRVGIEGELRQRPELLYRGCSGHRGLS